MLPRWLQYSFYLGCSWLWCIGAFFPLILLRDYGPIALTAFTLFNILGAAAFGFYFSTSPASPDSSAALNTSSITSKQQFFLYQHKTMMTLFSAVTVLFQLFFVVWLSRFLEWPWLGLLMLLLIGIIYRADSFITSIAIGLFIVSLICFFVYQQPLEAVNADSIRESLNSENTFYSSPWHVVIPLALGFIFSPYLDVTFHRAFSQSDKPRLTFFIGFGILFFVLLGFVFIYASGLAPLFFNEGTFSVALYPVIIFILLQTAFTAAIHLREYSRTLANTPPTSMFWVYVGIFAVVIGIIFYKLSDMNFSDNAAISLNTNFGEIIYKCFLFFYGLIFPAYLLLFRSSLSRKKTFYIIALSVLSPCYALGFLLGVEYTYALSIAMVILACIVLIQHSLSRSQL